jgi:hypothetical protein
MNHNIPRLTVKAWRKNSSQTPSASAHRLTLSSVVLSTPAGPLCPLKVLITPSVRFMSGLLLRSPCCVFCTVIHGCVLISQAVHVQSQLILGIFSGYGESALDSVCIVCTLTIRVNSSNLLQPFPWNLAQPVHPVTTEDESEAAEESQCPTRLQKHPPDSISCIWNWTPTNTESSGQEQAQLFTGPLTHIHSLTQCLMFCINYL